MRALLPFPIAVLLFAACNRTPTNMTLIVNATEKTPAPDAGPWTAKLLDTKTVTDADSIATVRDVIAQASKGTAVRCTFLEGGEPQGLRFELSDRSKIWVYGQRAVAMKGYCYEVDSAGAQRLTDLAKAIGIAIPPD